MTLDTNLSTKPYFDDFDQSKNYYQVLYRPSVAVQTRELNSMQSMLQDQINKFGRHVFKEGSVVEGCSFTYDNNYFYVKINDTYSNNYAIPSTTSFQGSQVINGNGLRAVVVNTIDGFQSQNPDLNTLYIKYLNSASYPNGVAQQAFANGEQLQLTTTAGAALGNVVVATVSNSTGSGYAFTTTEGVIFKKGFFLRVPAQTLVVTKYSNQPNNVSVGFAATESLITPEVDNNLVDNAAGAPNFAAPGAHRLKIVPNLITRVSSNTTDTSAFFSICDFKNGQPVSIKSDPQYAALGVDIARRTYETNGDYVVNPFILSTQVKTDLSGNANTNYVSLVSSPGVGYVKGYRVEFINNNTVDLQKGIDTETTAGQIVSSNFGYYFNVNQYVGDFNNTNVVQIELHSVAKTAISSKTFLSTSYSSSTKIGTAYCRGVAYSSGTPGVDAVYRLYVFNLNMNPGYSVSQIKSIIYQVSSSIVAVADAVLTYNATTSTSIAVINDSANEIMVHPFGQKALSTSTWASEQFVYRKRANGDFLTTGVLTITLPSANGVGIESFYNQGTYSVSQENSFVILPTATGYSANNTGTVSGSSGSNTLTGTVTSLTTDYYVGDYIYVNGETHRITSVTSTTLSLANNLSTSPSANIHQTVWPAGVPLNFQPSIRTISVTSSTATISLGKPANAAFGASVYFDVLRAATRSIRKSINRSSLVKIKVGNNTGGTTGPWCLGIPDVYKLNNVWVGTGTSYSKGNADQVSQFYIDNGQRDGFYGPAYLYSSGPISNNASLLVSIDHFIKDESQGHGYFNANSYPIDDANTSNTSAIQTYQIPQYTSRNLGTVTDLRDSIDFRPYANATANVITDASNTYITVNPSSTVVINVPSVGSYLPTPDSPYQATITHYLPRADRIVLTTSGEMKIIQGLSSNQPNPPLELPGTMTIGLVSMPPYPSLVPSIAKAYNRYDYAIQLTTQQTRRYTMADIGKISNRIDRLEYYTSLSLLEQSAQTLQVRSSTTGQNRFKNGILVEPFKDFTISNTNDPQFRIAIDTNRNEGRPFFSTRRIQMYYDSSSSSGVQQTGDMITLPYTTGVYQTQPYASKYHNCIEGNIYNYRGTITLDPPGTVNPDVTVNPEVVSNIDLSSNWVNLQKYVATAWGTSWGAWSTTSSSTSTQTGAAILSGKTTNPDGSISATYQTEVTNTTTKQLQQVGSQLSVQPTQTQVSIGNYVTNVSLLPYLKSVIVLFKAVGMKPSTTLYPYFNSVPVKNACMPVTAYSGSVTTIGGVVVTNDSNNLPVYQDTKGNYYSYTAGSWGTAITADSTGTAYGLFVIPDNTFKSGQLEFKLTNVTDLSQGESAVTTQATATFFGSPVSIQRSNAVLQVRDSTVATQEVTQQQTVQQSVVTYENNVVNIAAPTINPSSPVRESTVEFVNQGGYNGGSSGSSGFVGGSGGFVM